jgi:2-haloacid dehalogenase
MPTPPPVSALVFDVFGTVVDWRTSIANEVSAVARRHGVAVDRFAFADSWRKGYHDGMQRVRSGQRPYVVVDTIHRERLDEILPQFGLAALSEAERAQLNHAWRRLHPWPDSVTGLSRLKSRYTISPLSNGNVALLTAMAKFARLPWDCILSSELAGAFKPDPRAYVRTAEILGLKPGEVMMVAAHSSDLRAAASTGMRTGLVIRPLEYGPDGKYDAKPDPAFDVCATDFVDLARQMGA